MMSDDNGISINTNINPEDPNNESAMYEWFFNIQSKEYQAIIRKMYDEEQGKP